MRIFSLLKISFGLVILLAVQTSFALIPLPGNLTSLNSEAGETLLAGVHENYMPFLEQIVTQKKQTYCGVASSVIVLNALNITAPVDPVYSPYAYFTQDNFFQPKVTAIIPAEQVSKNGMTLATLQKALSTYPVNAEIHFGNKMTIKEFRTLAKDALDNGKGVILNFYRPKLQQNGHGHFSPIIAYNAKEDQFLLADVARFKFSPYWVKAELLFAAIQDIDSESNQSRGFLIVSPKTHP